MRLLIAGSRNLQPLPEEIDAAFDGFVFHKGDVTEVVSGGARGADDAGEAWAAINGIPVTQFPANWTRDGKAAGNKRNKAMAKYADQGFVFWDGKSSGSANMVTHMVALDKLVRVIRCR